MTRTSPIALVVAAIVGGALAYLLDLALTAASRPTFTVSFVLPLTLVLLGAIVIALAIPIRRATRGGGVGAPVDPFRAVRVAVLAKASSIVGAAMGGAGAGFALFLATRSAVPSLGSVGPAVMTVLCGAALVVAGLVAEQMCTIRKDDDDDDGPDARRVAADPPR